MNYGEFNINIGTKTFFEGEGDIVDSIQYGYFKNGIPYKIVKLK